MKKFLIGLLIALAVMVLLVVAMNACDNAPTALATVTFASPDGVVNPNLLSFNEYYDPTLVNSPNISTIMNKDEGLYISNTGYTFTDYNSLFLMPGVTFYVRFDVPSDGYYIFNTSVAKHVTSTFSVDMVCYHKAPNSSILNYRSNSASTQLDKFSLFNSYSSTSSNFYFTAGTKLCFTISPTSYVFELRYCKVERFSTTYSLATSYFSGFVVPGYSYAIPVPDPSPYDSWNGIVHPNLLSHTDFYVYPYYSSGSNDRPSDIYYSDAPSSTFSVTPTIVDTVSQYPCDFLVSDNTGLGLANSLVLHYRYTYRDIMADMVGDTGYRYPVTYSLKGYLLDNSTGASCSITLADNLNHSTSYTVSDFDNGVFLSSVTFSVGQHNWDYIDITVSFLSRVDFDLRGSLFYSKLEYGTLFTGFVPEEHNDLTVVNYNLLPNYDFTEVPSIYYAGTFGNNFSNWVYENTSGLDAVSNGITFSRSADALSLITSDSNTCSMFYQFVPEEELPDNTFNFALKAHTTSSIMISVYSLPYEVSDVPYARFGFAKSFGVYDLSVSFSAYSSGCRIVLDFGANGTDTSSSNDLYYAKLEYGDVFTGYVENYKIMSDTSYDAGYNQGTIDAGALYTSKTYTLVATQGESNSTIDMGYTDFGFSSYEEFNSGTFSIVPAFYTANGYPIVSSGFFFRRDLVNGDHIIVYASRDDIDASTYYNATNVFYLGIYDDHSVLVSRDELFNNDYLNFEVNRTVDLNVSKGFSELIDFYNEQYYDAGVKTGLAQGKIQGFDNGRAVGYDEGLKMAGNATWRGLVSAIVDVPVTTIVSFLDFEILGINMFSIFKTIVTITLFLFVVKLLIGKVGK